MRKKRIPSLTTLELAVMQVIWTHENVAVDFLRKQLETAGHPLALPSVRTMLAILQKKGFVERRLEGRAYLYRARIPASEFQQGFLRDLLNRAFNGSAAGLVTALLNGEMISQQELAQVKKMIKEFQGGQKS